MIASFIEENEATIFDSKNDASFSRPKNPGMGRWNDYIVRTVDKKKLPYDIHFLSPK